MKSNDTLTYVPEILVTEMDVLRDKFLASYERGRTIFLILDEEGKIYYVSRYIENILRFKPKDLVGTSIFKITDTQSILKLRHFMTSSTGQLDHVSYFTELSLICFHCQRHFFDGSFVAKSSEQGTRFLFYLHDATERKEENEKLSKVNLELDNFIYKASHDLRAPLLSLSGLITLSEITGSVENSEYTTLMRHTVKRLDQFITQLAHYTRNNNLSVNYSAIDFRELFSGIIEGYRYLDQTAKINFDIEIDNLEIVYSDSFRLKVIINNLVSNAIKYHNTNQSNPFIKLSVRGTGQRVIVAVTDNGTGIDPENIDAIFQMFKRGTEKSDGSGLGLYLVSKALKVLGGSIKVKSSLGLGSSFRIDIPNNLATPGCLLFPEKDSQRHYA